MAISVDCIEAASFTQIAASFYNNEFGIKIGPYSNKCMINEIRVLRGNFFQCHLFTMKSVSQNLKSFWRSSQNHFVFALFSSLYS